MKVAYIIIFALVIVALAVMGKPNQPAPSAEPSRAAESDAVRTSARETESVWTYGEAKDEMRGEVIRSARLLSETTLEFKFPYGGGSHVTLVLRRRGSKEDVMLRIDKGSFMCGISGKVTVRFDAKKIRQFQCSGTSDFDPSVIFIDPAKSFIKELKSSEAVMLETEFFQEGMRQFRFKTNGLRW